MAFSTLFVFVSSASALAANAAQDDTKASIPFSAPLTFEFSPAADQEDLEARVAMLEAMASELQQQLAQEHDSAAGEFTRIEELVGSVTSAGKAGAPISGFRVGDATVRLGGYVDFDFHATSFDDGAAASGSAARDFYIPGATPVGGDSTTVSDMTAQSTRFSMTATRDFDGKQAVAYLETDYLLSGQGNERVSSSFAQRLRRAYVDYNGWRIGQEWTTFQDLSVIPESASFIVLTDAMPFNRQALIRYTNGPWQFAAENGNTTLTATDGSRIEADQNLIPDLIARYNMKGDYGKVSISGIARQLRSEGAAADDETHGFGLAVQGRLNVGKRDDIRFAAIAGEGLGRYIGLNATNAAAIDPVSGDLEAISSFGGLLAWRHPISDSARVNVGYAGHFIDNPDFIAGSATTSTQSVFGAFLWDVAPKVTAGIELLHGIRDTEANGTGEMTRATFSIQYGF